jgi:hypothetical protein
MKDSPLLILSCNLFEREMWNVRSISSVLNRHGADVAVLVQIKLGVLIQVPCFGHFCHFKFDVQRVGVLKILDGHGSAH